MILFLRNTPLIVAVIGKKALNIEGEEEMARRKWIRGENSVLQL